MRGKRVSIGMRRQFFTKVCSGYSFNAGEGKILIDTFSENAIFRCYERTENIIRSGEAQTYLYFLYSGLVRCFSLRLSEKKSDKDKDDPKNDTDTNRFMLKQGEPFIAAPSLRKHDLAVDTIQALRDSEIFCVPLTVVEETEASYPDVVATLAAAVGESYIQMRKLMQIRQQGVEERCKWLHTEHPELGKAIQKQYLASFLGMSKETYSRCMHRLIEENAI